MRNFIEITLDEIYEFGWHDSLNNCSIELKQFLFFWGSGLCGVMSNVLNCEFELQRRYYIHFQINTPKKSINSLIHPVINEKVLLLFRYKDSFGIR